MKKVVFLISHIPNPRILKRINTLKDDFQITVLYWDRGLDVKENFEIDNEISVYAIQRKAPLGKSFARIIPLISFSYSAIKHLKDVKPEIIHAANLDMLLITTVFKKFFNRNTKIIYEVADLPKYCFIKKINSSKDIIAKMLQNIEKKLTRSVSKIILTSPYFWDVYFSKFISLDKYLFIPNAPCKSLFNNYKAKDKDGFFIGFIGSVRYVEQLKMLVDAVNELDKEIQVLIAGSGPGYAEMLEYVKGKNFVTFYGPYNYEREIVSLYETIDCVYSVYDTRFDNVKIALPNRLYEAIVCEIPIIGAKDTVLGDFIEENKIGFTVRSDNKDELKEKLLKIITSDELIDIFKKNCKRIKENYYYENNNELLNAYREL